MGSKRQRDIRRARSKRAQSNRANCADKVRLWPESSAMRVSVKRGLAYYRCRNCGAFHLTSQRPAPTPQEGGSGDE